MIILSNIKLTKQPEDLDLSALAASWLRTDKSNIASCKIHKKSVDARRKNDIHLNCSFLVEVGSNEAKLLKRCKNARPYKENTLNHPGKVDYRGNRPVVVGFGPAGMFAALTLARAGLKPIVLERGKDVDSRTADVKNYWQGGALCPDSNVQFGEGGAGTFSDGKLGTGIKDPLCKSVLRDFAAHGANPNILYDSKPHIGTDVLVKVVKSIREEIIKLGGEILFSAKLTDIEIENGCIRSAVYEQNSETLRVPCEHLVLSVGHSARDTFLMLKSKNIEMIRKPFAMGVRVEHLQKDIDISQYGKPCEDFDFLPPADYKLAVHLENGRSVYTFCMCPGGVIVNAASEENTYVTNGMSNQARDGRNANSALLVNVAPEDIEGDDVLAGLYLQRDIERRAFELTAGQGVPVQMVGDFIKSIPSRGFGSVQPTVLPKAYPCNINSIYPKFITDALKEGIVLLAKKLSAFENEDAVLTAPETRSSCPVRIVRNSNGQSVSLAGLYPSGEGAGYAGGITSAAVDGIRSALQIIADMQQ